MRVTYRTIVFAGLFAVASLGSASRAEAQDHDDGHGDHSGGHGGYSGGDRYRGGYGGGSYVVPYRTYYGNGGHDLDPHWHTKQTPYGNYSYYGNGRHDLRPHGHVETPYGITSYSNRRFSSTQSYSPPTPYGYRPW